MCDCEIKWNVGDRMYVIKHCPLHAAAPLMLEKLKAFISYDRLFPHVLSGDVPERLSKLLFDAKAAIAAAEKEVE